MRPRIFYSSTPKRDGSSATAISRSRGIGRVGTAIRYLDYKDVDGVQFPTRIVQVYKSPLLGRFEQKIDKFETKVKFPDSAFPLKKDK